MVVHVIILRHAESKHAGTQQRRLQTGLGRRGGGEKKKRLLQYEQSIHSTTAAMFLFSSKVPSSGSAAGEGTTWFERALLVAGGGGEPVLSPEAASRCAASYCLYISARFWLAADAWTEPRRRFAAPFLLPGWCRWRALGMVRNCRMSQLIVPQKGGNFHRSNPSLN